MENHEISIAYPARILTNMDGLKTLKELDLFPSEMIYIKEK